MEAVASLQQQIANSKEFIVFAAEQDALLDNISTTVSTITTKLGLPKQASAPLAQTLQSKACDNGKHAHTYFRPDDSSWLDTWLSCLAAILFAEELASGPDWEANWVSQDNGAVPFIANTRVCSLIMCCSNSKLGATRHGTSVTVTDHDQTFMTTITSSSSL